MHDWAVGIKKIQFSAVEKRVGDSFRTVKEFVYRSLEDLRFEFLPGCLDGSSVRRSAPSSL